MRVTAIPQSDSSATASTELQASLPGALQSVGAIITPIAAGMSGAGVFRVHAGDEAFVLKITTPDEPADAWRRALTVQRAAAAAGVAPRVIHVDESRRAVLSELIVDRSLAAHLGSPLTRGPTVEALGRMLATVHALPVPLDAPVADPRAVLTEYQRAIRGDTAVPDFVRRALDSGLADAATVRRGANVMSHNDVNPTNLIFDGERIMLLDWQSAAPNDPYYDLGNLALFLRFDDTTCRQLITAHDGASVAELPEAFTYARRVAALISGAAALHRARLNGHAGGDVRVEHTTSLVDVYAQLRAGRFDLRTASGQWEFGLALVKESLALP